jgi:hypothetical protein
LRGSLEPGSGEPASADTANADTGTAKPGRALLLERLLARADSFAAVRDWREEAFKVIAPQAPMPAVAAVSHRAAGGPRRHGWVFLATPVHYLAELSNVRIAGEGILRLEPAEAAALALDFNRVWNDAGVDLWAGANRLFCGFDAQLMVTTQDPELARGRHLESFLPAGPDGARLRRLMSEVEMWLFDHGVNRARRERAQLPISGLWLWGGGAPLASLPAVQGGAAGEDALFDAFPPRSGATADVMVVDSTPNTAAWTAMQMGWLAATLADLQRGRLERLDLSAGERRFVLSARWRRRFWRRAKPWWEYFE